MMVLTRRVKFPALGLLLILGLMLVFAVIGLSQEHHVELNKVLGIPAARYDELREEYEGNLVAQQQIDKYDPVSEYIKRFNEYIKASRAGDKEKITDLKGWFEEHYPDIGGVGMKTVRELMALSQKEAATYIDGLTDEERITLREASIDWLMDELKFTITHGKRRCQSETFETRSA